MQFSVYKYLIPFIFFLISCKTETSNNTFSKDIIYQYQLKDTNFNEEGLEFFKIRYISDGLEIEGFIVKPKHQKSKKLPAIVYCRGGNQSYGMLSLFQLNMMKSYAQKGFVVLASQLRGNTSSEGKDEFGGKDLNDILRLIDITKGLDFVDSKNINLLGYSRGGMNAYQISTKTDEINAIAVVGAPTSTFKSMKARPVMYTKVMQKLVGDSVKDRNKYINRSAIYWHKNINEPILILHGSSDSRVDVEEAEQLIDSFKTSKKPNFAYKIFEGGNHSIHNFQKERDSLIIDWFNKHEK